MTFPKFAASVLRGAWNAYSTDPDVFLIGTGGILAGGRRGLGVALLALAAARRADQYAGVYVSQTEASRRVMANGAQRD